MMLRRVYLFNINANALIDTKIDIYGIKNQVLITNNDKVLIGLGYDQYNKKYDDLYLIKFQSDTQNIKTQIVLQFE